MHGTEKDEQEELELKEVVKMIEVKWIIWVTIIEWKGEKKHGIEKKHGRTLIPNVIMCVIIGIIFCTSVFYIISILCFIL